MKDQGGFAVSIPEKTDIFFFWISMYLNLGPYYTVFVKVLGILITDFIILSNLSTLFRSFDRRYM